MPRSAPPSDRRLALLDAAIEEIARTGARGMRVEAVARLAGVSTALIYHHFGDRSTLLNAALEHIGERAETYTARSGANARDTLLARLADEVQDDDTVRTNSAAWGELRDSAIFDHSLRPTLAALTDRWEADIAEMVRAGQRDGSIDPRMDPRALGTRLSAVVEGISGRWLTAMITTGATRTHIAEVAATLLGPQPQSDSDRVGH